MEVSGGQFYPVDGIADSLREDFRVKVNLPDPRPHVLAFRVFDSNANVGGAQVQLKGEPDAEVLSCQNIITELGVFLLLCAVAGPSCLT